MRMIWALTPLTLSLSCLLGCAFSASETAGEKSVRGIHFELTASDRMEQAAANRLDPLAREMLGIEQQKTILEYYSQVSGVWSFDEARKALETARGMLFPMDDASDEGTSSEPDPG